MPVPLRKLPLSSPYLNLNFKDLLLHCAPCKNGQEFVEVRLFFAPAARQLRLHSDALVDLENETDDPWKHSPHFAAQDSDKPRSAVMAASSSCDDYDRASPPPDDGEEHGARRFGAGD
ncbi:hypothetical protein GGX14DRAFT_573376 [Mycena pura]|uniref:Uncharacterized protein n=1 Tax=Mycena pura TaxID=153505 RepID=A0AAD6UZR9_9AGAR|nr:hypothetical protein GGX14DRAFT_573376 [Mycena pura]